TPIVFVSAIAGVIAGLLYTYLVLYLLGTVWKGATHTDGFRVYPDLTTIAIGISVGIALSMSLLYIWIIRALKRTQMTRITQIYADNNLKNPRQSALSASSAFKKRRLTWASIFYNKRQALLSFITLTCGVLIVFSVGLNRRSFADSSQIRIATGGFSLWVETAVPVYHNLQTEEGRAKLALTDLPKDAQVIQLLKYSADDASCLNLNKVVTPNVLGIDMAELKNIEFKTAENSVYPALVDETVLQWSLSKKLGDTIFYTGEKGDTIPIVLAGTLPNSIFQGSILIDKALFSEIWSEISGSEIMLIKVPDDKISETKMLISQALNNYGVRVMTTGERLQLFYSVTDTYLTIFLTLGGLGLLLGIFSFIIVVRKNIIARRKEVMLYRSLGFDEKRIFSLLYKENIIIPLCAIATGTLGSLLGVIMGFGNVSVGIWLFALAFLILLVFCVIWFVKSSVRSYLKQVDNMQN
ncbi:MAG: ABC transporter permease, partial [Dysgonamonadaceae bacterium]|nr:ABC transporter permease [Dysgonamonadaceae bacterium]